MSDEVRSYHGQPVLKQPVWTWEVPAYFYTGGVAGAGAGLAHLSELGGNPVLARRAWAVALVSAGVSPALLSSDLGRPLRALNMFRMVKVTSPMSIGSWILLGTGVSAGISSANAWLGWFPRLARIAKPAAALLGLPLSTYTAALLANTAVPAWHEARVPLPFVFGCGAALSAGALSVIATPTEYSRPARRLALAAAALEGPLMEAMIRRTGEHRAVYRRGVAGRAAGVSRACIAVGAGLLAARGARSRPAAVLSGVLLSVGAIATRLAVFKAGFASAADPRFVIAPQRRAIEQGRRIGASRTEPGATRVQ